MKTSSKLAALGLTAGLAAGGAAGLVLTVPAVSGAQSTDTTVTEGTSDPGTATEGARPDRGARLAETLAPLVADGTLTQEQADKVIAALEAAAPEGRGGMRGGMLEGLDAAATALGITADELRTELQSGQTIAQVAEARGVDVQTVIDALVAEARTHLDEKVAAGDLTQEEADERLPTMTERITERVNEGGPIRGRHGGGMRGDDAPADAEDDGTTDTTVEG